MSNAISTVVYDAFRCFYYQFFIADNMFVVGATLVVALIMLVALIRNWDSGVVWAYCIRPILANVIRCKWANRYCKIPDGLRFLRRCRQHLRWLQFRTLPLFVGLHRHTTREVWLQIPMLHGVGRCI